MPDARRRRRGQATVLSSCEERLIQEAGTSRPGQILTSKSDSLRPYGPPRFLPVLPCQAICLPRAGLLYSPRVTPTEKRQRGRPKEGRLCLLPNCRQLHPCI
jgi:hypothetical protein